MKTIIKIFICLSLIYTPMFANAANVGGWNLSNPVVQGASTVYDATRNVVINGKDYIKDSWVKITPNASQVAKVLRGGAAGYALSVAVEQLLGSVDWVLDPANNQIKYKNKTEMTSWTIYGHAWGYSTFEEAAQRWHNEHVLPVRPNAVKTVKGASCTLHGISGFNADSYDSNNKLVLTNCLLYQTTVSDEEKSIPLPTVANQVISNAESSSDEQIKVGAQAATTAAAADIVAEAETDQTKARPIVSQAEANAETKPADEAAADSANQATGTSKPNTADPEAMDLSLEFPVFCNWAPTICEAAQVVISFPQTLTGWWESANQKADDWATSISEAYQDFVRDDELPNDDTTLDISEIPTPELQENAISWGASCPADVSIPISMQGVSSTLVFSWGPWCQLLSIIKPAIIASAYIGAAFIVLGLRT